jgi:hypothetical protein
MTDKELLELAAKAIGLEIRMKHYEVGGWHCQWHHVIDKGIEEWIDWNPLTDDGDALRLAAKLRIDIGFEFDRTDVAFEFESGGFEIVTEYLYDNPPTDKLAATRRAITRAAAEIGKAMKS